MSRTQDILNNMSPGRLKEPISYPACSMTEIKYINFLSSVAIGRAEANTRQISVKTLAKLAQVEILEKPGAFGELTGLVLASEDGELEGMVVSDYFGINPGRVHRPLYGNAKYIRQLDQESDERQLEIKLDYLGLPFPDSKLAYSKAIISLLDTCNLRVGGDFIGNMLLFTKWIDQNIPAQQLENWGVKRK